MSRSFIFRTNDARWFGFAHPRIGAVIERVAKAHLKAQVADAELRKQLKPDYRIGCKRVLVSDDFYPALERPNVELVTMGIKEIRPHEILTEDGRTFPADVIVLATGFEATRPSIAARFAGTDGSTLADAWDGGMFALRGAAVPGFPNLFLLHGPNAALSHNSAVFMIESQIEYAVAAITAAGPGAVLEARSDATGTYNTWLDRRLEAGVWATGGCTSFYLDGHGRNTVLWPLRAAKFRAQTHRFDQSEYVVSSGV